MKPKQHLITLDFLRGIAALFVVLFHFSGTGLPKIMQDSTKNLFSWGYLGVEIFFVISGFIIPFTLIRGIYKIEDFGQLIGKRFIRICPPSYIVILLTILQFFIIDFFNLSQNQWFKALSFPQIVHNFLYTIPFSRYEWLNGIFWTLAVEFQYYLIIGLIFTVMFKSLQNFIFCSLFISGIFYTSLSEFLLFFQFGSLFIIGSITLLFFEKRLTFIQYISFLIFTCIICYIQLGLLPAIFGLATSLTISFLELKNKIFKFLGKISYSLYLTHILIGSTLEAVLVKLVQPNSPFSKFLLLILILAITILGSYYFYKVFEIYFINLANRVYSTKKKKEVSLETQAI